MVAISTTGSLLDVVAYAVNNIALIFLCASTFGRSWQHGHGDKRDLPNPGPRPKPGNLTDTMKSGLAQLQVGDDPKPPNPADYYQSPFDECKRHSDHTEACGLLYTTRFFILISIFIIAISYIYERLPMVRKAHGETKRHFYTGGLWILSAIMHLIGLCTYTGWINANSAFFKQDIDAHFNFFVWGYGQAYNFGWIGVVLELLSAFMFIYFGWAF